MFVEFKKLSFCNIMSYGASGAEIDFQAGLNTIKAANGSGKSSILDALTFVLFGKPYRDIKLSELVNTSNGKGLDDVFNQCVFAIGSLGRHRSGITTIKTLKNREYAARGIPFIYSENDADFDGKPYILKAPADESPVNMQRILSFIDNYKPAPTEIRSSVMHLSWRCQMAQVIAQCNP